MMTSAMPNAPVGKAWEEVSASFDRFCLAAGIETLGAMMEADAELACGPRHSRSEDRRGHRWGRTAGKIGFHAGKVAIERPRVRGLNGTELPLASWEQAVEEDWLGRWAMNLMLINVSTRKYRRAVRLPEGDVPAPAGSGVSKSAASRHFVALSAARMKEWMASDLSKLDLLVVQIDGIHMTGDLVLVAAIGIDGNGVKHPLGLIEGATENAAVVQALIDNLVARGLDPAVPRLFIIDGSKALSKAIRRTFGREALSQRCQKYTRRATSWSGCRSRCTLLCAGCCARPGS
jgi:transposase-like protein